MNDPSFKSLLKNRRFVSLWASQMLSQFTIQIMTFFVLTRVFTLTQSTLAVSFLWISSALPALLFGPFSGAIVDNFSRRKLMMITTLLQAGVVCLLLFTTKQVFYLYTIVFLYWLLDQLYYPSQQASAPSLVTKQQLPMVNGLFLLTQQASIVVGFGLGGFLISTIGQIPTVILAVFNVLFSSLAVSRLPHDQPRRGVVEKNVAQFFQDFVEGYQFVKGNRWVLAPIATIAVSMVFLTIISTSVPSYAHNALSMDIYKASTTLIAPAALGAIFGTLIIPRLLKKYRKSVLISQGCLFAGFALVGMAAIPFLPFAKIVVAVVIAICLGISATLVIIPAQSFLQEKTPSQFRGRVFGQMGFLLNLATTVPLVASAAVADALGISTLMGLLGGILIAGYLYILYKKSFSIYG